MCIWAVSACMGVNCACYPKLIPKYNHHLSFPFIFIYVALGVPCPFVSLCVCARMRMRMHLLWG